MPWEHEIDATGEEVKVVTNEINAMGQ